MSKKRNKTAADASSLGPGGIMAMFIPMAVVVIAALFYTAGWSFAYHYFDRFGLGLIGLDIQMEYFFLYSFWVFKKNLGLLFAGFVAAALFWGCVWVYLRKRRAAADRFLTLRQSAAVALVLMFVAGQFPIFYYSGRVAARHTFTQQAETLDPFSFPSYPGVTVWINDDGKKGVEAMADEWETGCYRLLLNNKEKLYLFYPAGVDDHIPVDVIPMSRVKAFRVSTAPATCDD